MLCKKNFVRLGKKKYKIYRSIGSGYDDYGNPTDTYEELTILANIQGALLFNRMYQQDSGERSKECISIRSNQRLYQASTDTNGNSKQADLVEYEGALWEVRECRSYNNLTITGHDEALAIRVDESVRKRMKIKRC